MNTQLCILLTAMVAVLAATSHRAVAQGDVLWIEPGTGDYTVDANWENEDLGFNVPPDSGFDEDGVINNGGTAQVSTEVFPGPRDMVLGEEPDDSGTLEILSDGVLPILRDFQVGNGTSGGEGHLIVHPGGTVTVGDDMRNRGDAASSIRLGGIGAGTATVTVTDEAELLRNTHVIGANVDFSAASITLGAGHTLTAGITGPTHSPLRASGGALLGGNLRLEFDGPTPSVGDTWQIVDAASISGDFSSVTSNVPVSQPGYAFVVETVAGGVNGQVAQATTAPRLILEVDRQDGAVTLSNLTSSVSFDVNGYLITSTSNSLAPMQWNSFEEAGQTNWRESNPAPNHLGELNRTGSRVVGPEQTISLGDIYSPSQFGVADDLTFEYHIAGGESETGLIQYKGPHNNLVLIVDPDTGEAALQNQSTFDVDINGYLITSASNALNPGGWTSFQESRMAGWRESNPASNHIGELNRAGSSLLGGRQSSISLGTLFDINDPEAEQDLSFEFHVAGGETMVGIVEYGEIPDIMPPLMLDGDYNDNGRVEQGDLDLVLLNWGQPFGDLPITWQNQRPTTGIVDQAELDAVLLNWGSTGGALGAAAVPEPTTCMLAISVFVVAGMYRWRTRSTTQPISS